MLTAAGVTSTGLVRQLNEDQGSLNGERLVEASILAVDGGSRPFFAVLADGMGGHARGEVASDLVLRTLERHSEALFQSGSCESAMRVANRFIYDAASSNPEYHGMGSTLVGIAVRDDLCTWFNVGDSRAYLLRDGTLTQMSHDHVPNRGASSNRRSHAITQSLGGGRNYVEIYPSIGEFKLMTKDRIVLCSDGLTDVTSDEQLRTLLLVSAPAQCLENLLAHCFGSGAPDNVTIILMDWS